MHANSKKSIPASMHYKMAIGQPYAGTMLVQPI